jgi:hypothetical protein
MLAQGCRAHYGRMASNQVVRLHPSGTAYGKNAEPYSEDAVVDMEVWKGRASSKGIAGARSRRERCRSGSKRRMIDLGHNQARPTVVPGWQDHPSRGGGKNASQYPKEGRVWAAKERQACAPAG